MDHRATTYLLQVEGMECSQHTAQSQQPVSEEDTKHIRASLCFRTTLILNTAPPGKGRDSVKLTALSTAIPRDTWNRRKLNF